MRVDLVVLGLAAVNGFHRERVAQHEGNPFGSAEVCEPVPREHALGRDDQIVSIRDDRLEERLWGRLHVAMHQHLASRVQDADVHRLHVEIDSAIVAMLTVVESHRLSSCAWCAFIPASAYCQSVGAGGGLNKHHALAADEGASEGRQEAGGSHAPSRLKRSR